LNKTIKSRVRRQFVDIAYGQIHLRIANPDVAKDQGAEIPLVCLHQSPKSGREFERFLEIAGADRQCIAPDYPGYGESDRPDAEPPVRILDYAHSIWQALDVLEVDKVDLFGNHTGDLVAVEMAYQRPERVRKIAMISAPVLTAEEQEYFDNYFQPIPLDEEGTRFTYLWNLVKKHRSAGATLEMMATSFSEGLRGGDAYEWGHHAAFAYNDAFIERISQLEQPITVLNPADMLYEITLRVEPLLKNGKLIDLPQWGGEIINIHARDVYKILTES